MRVDQLRGADVCLRLQYRDGWRLPGAVRLGVETARARRIAGRLVPSADVAATASIRGTIGLAAMASEALAPTWLQSTVHLGARIMLIMAVWTLIAHVERQVTIHVREGVRRLWQRATPSASPPRMPHLPP